MSKIVYNTYIHQIQCEKLPIIDWMGGREEIDETNDEKTTT